VSGRPRVQLHVKVASAPSVDIGKTCARVCTSLVIYYPYTCNKTQRKCAL